MNINLLEPRLLTLAFFGTPILAIIWAIIINRKIPSGQTSVEPFNTISKVAVFIMCLLAPILVGAILYYGLHKKFPAKARFANISSFIALFIEIVIFIIVPLFFPLSAMFPASTPEINPLQASEASSTATQVLNLSSNQVSTAPYSTQTITDSSHLTAMEIPASWVSDSSAAPAIGYAYAEPSSNGDESASPTISLEIISVPNETACESHVIQDYNLSSATANSFQANQITVPGAQKAIAWMKTDSLGITLAMEACTSYHEYVLFGENLGDQQTPDTEAINELKAAISTFKVVSP
jgi:hypothetical protein